MTIFDSIKYPISDTQTKSVLWAEFYELPLPIQHEFLKRRNLHFDHVKLMREIILNYNTDEEHNDNI